MKKLVWVAFLVCGMMLGWNAYGQAAEMAVISHAEGSPMIVRDGKQILATVGANCQTNDIFSAKRFESSRKPSILFTNILKWENPSFVYGKIVVKNQIFIYC